MTSTSIYSASIQDLIPVLQSKICTKCNIEKDKKEFYKMTSAKDGLRHICKSCAKEYRLENIEHIKKTEKEYRSENKEYLKEYWVKYGHDNKGIVNAIASKYRATKLNATPKWAEIDLIKQLYIDCKLISEMTGIIHHVDHIVPLQSEIVRGLHCIANLQILSESENISKGNRYWPDMW